MRTILIMAFLSFASWLTFSQDSKLKSTYDFPLRARKKSSSRRVPRRLKFQAKPPFMHWNGADTNKFGRGQTASPVLSIDRLLGIPNRLASMQRGRLQLSLPGYSSSRSAPKVKLRM